MYVHSIHKFGVVMLVVQSDYKCWIVEVLMSKCLHRSAVTEELWQCQRRASLLRK